MNNIAPKLQNTQNCLQNRIKNAIYKATKFLFQSVFCTSKGSTSMFYLSMAFGLSFVISSVAPTQLSTFYAYLIARIGKRNLNRHKTVDRGKACLRILTCLGFM